MVNRTLDLGLRPGYMTTSNSNPSIADQEIYARLAPIFQQIFEDRTIILHPETSQADIAGWDSFSNASLIAAIEKDFAVRFRTAELQTLQTVRDFVELIRVKLPSRG
jgi:acyl carrier protein